MTGNKGARRRPTIALCQLAATEISIVVRETEYRAYLRRQRATGIHRSTRCRAAGAANVALTLPPHRTSRDDARRRRWLLDLCDVGRGRLCAYGIQRHYNYQ